jgi:L-lactate dehydrogenase complex protein LldG
MKDTTSKEKMLKKIRKALLEKRDNPYPNLEDTPLYEEYKDHIDLLFAEQIFFIWRKKKIGEKSIVGRQKFKAF